MNAFRAGYSVILSDIALLFRKALGCKVSFHTISLVSPRASIMTKGKGHIFLGRKSCVRHYAELSATDGSIRIGNNCFINRDCMLVARTGITLEDNVTIGPGTYIYDHDHDGSGGYVTAQVVIRKGAWIGASCVILKGVTIGENAVVAAGSIITKDVADNQKVIQKRN